MNWRNLIVLGLLALGSMAAWATVNRYEVTHGGSDRYYVVIKLDRWTGQAWKLETGGVWVAIAQR